MSRIRLPLFLLAASTLTLATVAGAGPVYKWVDEKGVTHYGEKAPDGAAVSKVKISDTTSSDAEDEIERLNKQRGAQEEERKKAAGESSPSAADKARISAACDQNRKNLAVLRSGKQVRVTDETGQPRQLDETQVAEQIRFAEQELQRCEQLQKIQQSVGNAPVAPAR